MGDKYLFTNCIATFLFDSDFKIAEKVENDEVKDYSEWLESEKKLMHKHSKDKIFYIGFKKEKLQGAVMSQDPQKLSRILDFFKKNEFFKSFHEINLLETKMKVRAAVDSDLLVIQTINNIDELNKAANLLIKRLREWYELYNPEFSRSIESHEKFVELILANNKDELLKQIGLSKDKTMGADLPHDDVKSIMNLAKQIDNLYKLRESHTIYLETLMNKSYPNITAVAGSLIGAKIISLAGSLERLVKMPASTVQLLGAEKALFRHMRQKTKPPKHGVIIQHPLLNSAKQKDKGKVARVLADKISIATRVDYYKGQFVGDRLKKEIEERVKQLK